MHTVSIWRRWAGLAAFTGQVDPVARTVILGLRLPRTLAGDLSLAHEPWPALLAAALASGFAITFGRALSRTRGRLRPAAR